MPPKKVKAELPTPSMENQFRFDQRPTFTEDQVAVIDGVWNLSTHYKDSKIKLGIITTLIAQYARYNKDGAVAEADDDDKIQLLLSQAEGKALGLDLGDAFKAAFDLRDGKLGAAAEAKKGKVEESDDGYIDTSSESMAAVSISSDSQPSDQSPPSQMSAEEKFIIVRSIGEECIQDEELRNLLANKPKPICYDGFEPSGRMHIAQGVMKAINVNKLTSAGCKVKFWIADGFARLNKKMGGDLRKIKVVGEYFIEIWKVVGMNIDEDKVEFLWSSEEIKSRRDEYWELVTDIAMRNNVARVARCCQIMGRSDQDELTTAQILYPCMQCADIFFLKADICQMGMDQRKVNMLAREYCDDIKRKNKPIILSHHMLPGLQQGQEKMSKSDPSSSIFMEDEEADVNVKIKKAYCPPKIVAGNPCLEYIKYIVLPWFNEFTIERSADNGGPKTFTSFEELALDYESGAVHPGDLKPSLSKALNKILQPVRDHFKNNDKARDLIKKVKGYKVTK